MSGFKNMMPLLILIAVLVFGVSFMIQMMGTVEAGADTANLSQPYQDQLNSTRDANIITVSFSKYIGLLLGVVALIIAIMWIYKHK